ncbi:peptide MFS transporter [Pedobacter cryoconitis]|uniref:POT family proton-dependent oligopeptide transporter n=1 Tax=Pedobacter cryoconitis TaxID=188932 RepID=A0A7X0MIC4_9SPHI|nr:peptide MFS transporter [Pedobacter cryoconitis]MBB6498303.1 POT family proton-dependent oligopeptide transporter [Pedobacter cryoconitis]
MDQSEILKPEQLDAAQKGHPKGLYVLFATEMWERFNYYGMRAVLVLFMTKALLFDKAFASNLYGSYTGLVYLTPLIGGFIADKYWGNRRSIVTGGILMALGELIMFGCASLYHTMPDISTFLFFTGLGFMISGNGFFKPNISSMVGQLYPKNDRRIDAAYTIFYMGINVGGALGPFICGFFGDTGNPADFKWAFLAGAIAMAIGVIVFIKFRDKYVRDQNGDLLGLTPANPDSKKVSPVLVYLGLFAFSALCVGMLYIDAKIVSYLSYLLMIAVIGIAVMIFTDKTLTKIEKKKISVIFIVAFFVLFFWSAFEQAGASLTFFAEEQTQRNLGFFTVPSSWFQSLNSIFVVAFAPIFAWLWIKLGKREPSAPTKMALGLLLLALGYLVIATGVKDVGAGIKVSMIYLIGMYAFHTWGELCLSPIGLSLVNKLSPLKLSSLLMAVWFLANAGANVLAGKLSSKYPEEEAKVAEYKVSPLVFTGSTINWKEVSNSKKNIQQWELSLVKKNAHSISPDSLVALSINAAQQAITIDTNKINRISPKKLSAEEVKKLQVAGETEGKFVLGTNAAQSEIYIIKGSDQNASVVEVYNLNPEKPTFMGYTIKNLYDFFMLFVVMAGIASLLLFFLTKWLQKTMNAKV